MSIARKRSYQANLSTPDSKLHNEDSNMSVCSSGGGATVTADGGGAKKGGGVKENSAPAHHDDEEEDLDEGELSGAESDVPMEELHDPVRIFVWYYVVHF